jgi:hypothetical protein
VNPRFVACFNKGDSKNLLSQHDFKGMSLADCQQFADTDFYSKS